MPDQADSRPQHGHMDTSRDAISRAAGTIGTAKFS